MADGNGFFDNMDQINMDERKKGIEDAFAAGQPSNPYRPDSVWMKKFKISPYDMNQIFNTYLGARQAYKAKFNEKMGEKFLAENAKKSGVKVTESGLQYVLHAEGEGEKVMPEDRVVVMLIVAGVSFVMVAGACFVALSLAVRSYKKRLAKMEEEVQE